MDFLASKKVVISIILIIIFLATGFIFIFNFKDQIDSPTTSTTKKVDSNTLGGLFIREETSKYYIQRGLLTEFSKNFINLSSKDGEKKYEVNSDTRMICLDESAKNQWLDLQSTLASERGIYNYELLYFTKSLDKIDINKETQVIVATPKSKEAQEVIFVISCK